MWVVKYTEKLMPALLASERQQWPLYIFPVENSSSVARPDVMYNGSITLILQISHPISSDI